MTEPTALGNRIVVVGLAGSGKTTLARSLADRLERPHIELDEINWQPDWVQRPADSFLVEVSRAIAGERWVVDGNYSRVRPVLWKRADTLIWLDYAFTLVSWRLFKRTLRRILTRETLWSDNRESISHLFSPKDNLFLYNWRRRQSRFEEYQRTLRDPAYGHLALFHFKHPAAADRLVKNLTYPVQ